MPRVNRKRQVYCSSQNKPSLTASQLASLRGPVKEPVEENTTVAAKVAPPKVVKEKPKKTVRKAPVKVAAKPKPKPKRVVQPVAVAPEPVEIVIKTPEPAAPKKKVRTASSNGLFLAQRDLAENAPVARLKKRPMNQPIVKPIRTRRVVVGQPQAVHPGDLVRAQRLAAARAANASASSVEPVASTSIVDPVHQLTTVGVVIDPDVTAEGDLMMEQVWTNTVPRRLIKRKVRVRKVAQTTTGTTTRISTKSVEPKKAAAKTGRFVQVGTFGDADNAARTTSRFRAAGLPVSSQSITRKGKRYQVVFLGPFGASGQAQAGLTAARRAGFSDAFFVK